MGDFEFTLSVSRGYILPLNIKEIILEAFLDLNKNAGRQVSTCHGGGGGGESACQGVSA